MNGYQPAIFEEGNAHHLFLEFATPSVTGPLPGGWLLQEPVPRLHETFAFSAIVLDAIDHRLTPEGLIPFKEIHGVAGFHAPATQGDIFIWIQGNQRDEVFARGLAWTQALESVTELDREEHGFLFRDNRDLTGFIDGSANPTADARFETALLTSGTHAAGSFVFTQRWHHNLAKFHELGAEAQEKVIGRTRKSGIELKADEMPRDSHTNRTNIKRNGKAVKIYNRSVPTGGMLKPGLFFLAFAAELPRFTWLLESMFGTCGDGCHDQWLSYSTPLSGSFYFAPNQQALSRVFG